MISPKIISNFIVITSLLYFLCNFSLVSGLQINIINEDRLTEKPNSNGGAAIEKFNNINKKELIKTFNFSRNIEEIEAMAQFNASKKSICSVSLKLFNFKTIAALTNPPSTNPNTKTSDLACETYCDLSGVVDWTRRKSTNDCWCNEQPFGNGGSNSAYYDTDWNSGFYPNLVISGECPALRIQGQKLNSDVLSLGSAISVILCEYACKYAVFTDYWTWRNDQSIDNCYCLGTGWSSVALEYNANWWFGIRPG